MAYRYIVQSTERKDDILLLTLAPKKKSRHMTFEPGQYATIGFTRGLRPTPMRCFSIVSTPSSGVLQFAMRVKGNFTQAATRLHIGSVVRVQGPFGEFTVNPEYDRSVVMLAGGIGVTPFLGMIRDATDRQVKLPMTLWYSNRSAARIPFHSQLKRLAEQNPNLTIKLFNADTEGKVTAGHLQELCDTSPPNTTYFICGPRGFSDSMQSALQAAGVHESRILSELFAQSSSTTLGSGLSIPSLTYGLSAAALVLFTGAIMLLDLRQNLPRVSAARTPNTTQTSGSNSASSNTEDSGSSTSPNNTSSGSTNSNSSTTQPQNTPSPNYTNYQSPVSSVS